MEVRKFESSNSTRRTLLFKQSCHDCSDNAGTFIIVKVNSYSEGEMSSCNRKKILCKYTRSGLGNKFSVSEYFGIFSKPRTAQRCVFSVFFPVDLLLWHLAVMNPPEKKLEKRTSVHWLNFALMECEDYLAR